MCYENNLIIEMNPTVLYTWKGTRTSDEENYHSHDLVEMAFILSGSGNYRIDDTIYPVTEGDILILNPGVMHQALITDSAIPTTEFFVGFSDFQLRGLAKNTMLLCDNSPILHTSDDFRQKLFKLCISMAAEYSVCKEGRYYMLQSYLVQMILMLIRQQTHPVKFPQGCAFNSTNKQYVVEQIINYLEDHYSEKISLDQIAANMYLSPYYISRIFKSEMGEAPIQHLINIRLAHAMELLKNGWNGSIQEVSYAVGYDDAYHFSKLFKKKYGVSPSKVLIKKIS